MIGHFAEKISLICGRHQCSVTSWFRTEKRNKDVGGHIMSQHQLGLAVDLVPDQDNSEGYWEEVAIDCRRLGLVAVVERDHIHVQALRKL
jgi:hypothetical protein